MNIHGMQMKWRAREMCNDYRLDGHEFSLSVSFNDVLVEGRGWRIFIPEASSASPEIKVTDQRLKSNAILDKGFQAKVLRMAQIRARHVRAEIASDWPRQSIVPDAKGYTQHPLFGGIADRWYCLHCNGTFSGMRMAENLWHCPACSAAPIDIFEASEILAGGQNPPLK
jgi:hypothetical protein